MLQLTEFRMGGISVEQFILKIKANYPQSLLTHRQANSISVTIMCQSNNVEGKWHYRYELMRK